MQLQIKTRLKDKHKTLIGMLAFQKNTYDERKTEDKI